MTIMAQRMGGVALAGVAGFSNPDEVLSEVLRRTEASFLSAGDELVGSVDLLRLLGGQFDRLRVVFGPQNGARLLKLVGGTKGNLADVQDSFTGFLEAGDALRSAVRGVRIEVADLDRVVRTIANVSINARIQGNGLNPPRPQVTAFIERLAAMAAEAEGILADVRGAMAVIGDDMAAMEEETQGLRIELGQRVLPALARFGRVAEGVLRRQDGLAATNAELGARMAGIDAEVARLVIALQSGDATRQRLERVRDVLAQARGGGPLEPVLLDLAKGLAAAAVEAAAGEIGVSVKAAEAVRSEAEQTVAQARSFYLDRADEAEGGVEGFRDAILAVRARLDGMRERSLELRLRLWAIFQHEAALRQIGHQVRLSGLNAVLICAKLGEEGRALRELAQWLRTLTDESDTIVANLQQALARTADLADALGGDTVAKLDATLRHFFDESTALGAVIGEIGQGRADASRLFDEAGRHLPLRLGQAAQQLTRFQLLLREMALFDAALAARRAMFGPRRALDDEGKARLAVLRGRYTMQSERDVHDRVAGGDLALVLASVAPPAPVPTEGAERAGGEHAGGAGGDDGLDDIFF